MRLSDRYLPTRNLTMAKSATVLNLDKRWYSAYEPNWDNRFFRELLLPAIDSTKTVLDYGAGRGHVPHMNFKGIAKFVAGIDPDKAVFENPYLDEAKVLELPAGIIPYPDATFDIVFADNVMEHIEHPDTGEMCLSQIGSHCANPSLQHARAITSPLRIAQVACFYRGSAPPP